jgi:hypothetical protein
MGAMICLVSDRRLIGTNVRNKSDTGTCPWSTSSVTVHSPYNYAVCIDWRNSYFAGHKERESEGKRTYKLAPFGVPRPPSSFGPTTTTLNANQGDYGTDQATCQAARAHEYLSNICTAPRNGDQYRAGNLRFYDNPEVQNRINKAILGVPLNFFPQEGHHG